MKALFIGGTGNISLDISKMLLERGWELTLLNRGVSASLKGAELIRCDVNSDECELKRALEGRQFDVAVDFIAFSPSQVERDIRLLEGKVKQFIFISSASAYQKPPASPFITESTPLNNPYWHYSRQKAACEDILMRAFRENGFPVTIVRPSHTYSERALPLPLHGKYGAWQVIKRMIDGKRVLVHDGGATLWVATQSCDFARGFIGLMGNIHAIGESVHITSDEVLTWNQIMTVIADCLGVAYKPCYIPSTMLAAAAQFDYEGAMLGDKGNSVIFDNEKIKRLVPGFACTTRFDEGARQSIEYFLGHPEMQKPDPEFDVFCDNLIDIMDNAEQAVRAL